MANQFSVPVPDLNQAIAGGEESYNAVQKLMQGNQLKQAREVAAKNIMDGGDPKQSFATLMGIGDKDGANTLATFMHNQQTGDFQNRQLGQQNEQFGITSAETARTDRAREAQATAALEETKNQHRLDLGKPLVAGEDPYTGGKSYIVRDNTGAYVPLVIPQRPQPGQPAPPQVVAPGQLPPPSPSLPPPRAVMPGDPLPGAVRQSAPQQAAPTSSDPEEQRKAAFLASRPPQVANIIKGIANYDMDARTMLARLPAGARTRIMSDVAEYRPDYNQQNYPASQAAYTKFTSGKESATVRSFSVGLEHLDQLGELGAALKNDNLPLLNSLANKVKTFTGDANPTNFNGLKAIVGAEIVKAIVGAGGTGEERAAAAKTVNDASSPAQLNGIIDTYKKAMGAQLGGLKQTYETGTMRNDFGRMLSPGAVKAFEAHQRAMEKTGAAGQQSGTTPSGVKWSIK